MIRCENCNIREATVKWAIDPYSLVNGYTQDWCELCVTKAQLSYALTQSERIPELQNKLKMLEVQDENL
jgi:hypothetical protein